ncbi:GAF domain-containing sensor histidine kinase [Frankia sp. CNm7]|uniref:GAF domain-containing sensor histidine kinase n=1 Tax=Frankia nepalensis TaxID=1836974 RepID=A0A937RLW5_9ACTN|nr:GAF domain-containing sensor histidine kinase [Frankia nepalensis]MBL7499467.1 GAF domain-containing sensor histidine kinase [Frankia nepalensis]MBL7513731.1 GAF domain-containing sensor histidine kinase [Frankia nepalensis]MBL7522882.1 GAF domain-containing sensor histidine kinase [Frankia nepalensis]MBL7628301.1 GAF domain-containing sensor histidine kinase [Frankia nepalensis]
MFPTVARLELDELLTQLVDRAQDVLATQGRLRGLLRANRMVTADLRLPTLLRLVVEAACDLLDARYGALGVVAPDRTLEEFVHVGMDPADVERIGHLPTGHGVLGVLIDDPCPLRVDDISQDPSAVGFPPGHPPMHTFLGVPITVRGEVFGNLYLTEKRDGRAFTAEDEELALALAATAGVAIDNARLFDDAQQRHRWMSASAEVTHELMADPVDPITLVVERARATAHADYAAMLARSADPAVASVEVAVGADTTGNSVPLDASLAGRVFTEQRPILTGDAGSDACDLERGPDVGSIVALPLAASADGEHRVLLLGRDRGRRAFTAGDLDMASSFAGHVAVALELARAKAERERLVVLADRGRIARDLHDHVIQRMFAVALGIQDVAQYERTANADRLNGYVEDIDATIKDIRRSIFELRGSAQPGHGNLRAAIEKIAADAEAGLGFAPIVTCSGPLNMVVGDTLAAHLLAVVREAVSNAARHSRATAMRISVRLEDDEVVVDAEDNGVGIGDAARSSGLANLRERAESLGGKFTLAVPAGGGTQLRWTAPI